MTRKDSLDKPWGLEVAAQLVFNQSGLHPLPRGQGLNLLPSTGSLSRQLPAAETLSASCPANVPPHQCHLTYNLLINLIL